MRVKSGKPAAPRRKGQKMKKVLKFLCSRVVIVTLLVAGAAAWLCPLKEKEAPRD